MRSLILILIVGLVSLMLIGCGGPARRISRWYPDPVTTPSGLIYQDFRIGTGDALDRGDVVSVRYTTYLQDGTEVDNKDQVFIGGVHQVITGLDEGVGGMLVGGQRKLTVPPDLAYGSQGRPPDIPSNATLTIYAEVLNILPEHDEGGVSVVDIVEGYGLTPSTGDTLVVNYTGWLESNGQKFDSGTYDFVLGTGSVIQGWHNGLATMRLGGKRRLKIPPELAYGDNPPGEEIPPGATLIFEVDLLEIR